MDTLDSKIEEIADLLPRAPVRDLGPSMKIGLILAGLVSPFVSPKIYNIAPEAWLHRKITVAALQNSLHVTYGDRRPWIAYSDPNGRHIVTFHHAEGILIYELIGWCPELQAFLARWPD